jgi:hypothetical protein
MRNILMGAAALAALALSMPANAAERCEDVIRSWESHVSSYPSRAAERGATEEYNRAREAARRGDNSQCLAHMDRAAQIVREESARRDDSRYSDRRYDDRNDRRTEGSGGSSNPLSDIIRNLGR